MDKQGNIDVLYENLNFLRNQNETKLNDQEKMIQFLNQNIYNKDQEINFVKTKLTKNDEEYDMLVERFNSLEIEKEEIFNRNSDIIHQNREEIRKNQAEVSKLSEQILKMSKELPANSDAQKDMNQILVDREDYFNIREKKNELEKSVGSHLEAISCLKATNESLKLDSENLKTRLIECQTE